MKRNCSILVVEDDADDAFFITDALRRSGVTLPMEVARNGQEAIEFLSRASERGAQPESPQPCLVFLDLNLPLKTGFEVLRWIRQESCCKIMTVVVLTSSTSDADMERAYLLGANSYLIKPADATKLREIGELVKRYWLEWNQTPAHSHIARKSSSAQSSAPL